MYNADVFENAPQSWSVVFEEQNLPDGKSNKGRVEAYYGPIYIADAALYLMTHKPELGIKDPYALTKPQFDAAIDLLRAQRQIVNKYWGDAAAQVDDFTTEGVVASTSWPYPGERAARRRQGQDRLAPCRRKAPPVGRTPP